ncbi:hypothetical protein [Micrococcus sp. TA1]|uniref:hypothetical protein n=1 Tax=Micrococcus sp. TA1 TaxID=681627 RepID=UPI0016129FFA|nr:hypothetical protein [Micrococcus sp. TA1]MBB5749588.1 hypothetical protein [Micrococcus sp. TA1]
MDASSTPSTPQNATLNRDELQDYLNHHLLGSRSGVRMFRTAADTWRGTPYEAEFKELTDQVSQMQDRLIALIDRLGLKQSRTEKVLGKAAEVAGRLNPVNLTRSKTQGMTQVELDILQGALQGQIGMWQALVRLAELVPDGGLDRESMDTNYRRTRHLQDEVRRISEETLGTRFLT